ncbi:MAG: sigma-70 family RNA polymerase sigma factor [Myxococcota bacterium]|nr:sigma-70 family RNA polymerase sigma factor [Myxococcota bacterium]
MRRAPMGQQEEQDFILALKRRDEAAFSELVRRHQHQVYNLVLRMLGNREEAEDVAQEVFVAVFRSIDGFREESSLATWLYRVATNHCKNRLKYLGRRQRGKLCSLDVVAEHDLRPTATQEHYHPPDQLLEGHQAEREVQQAIAGLEPEQRLVILLREVEGLSYQQIEEVTGLPPGTVRSRLHRARLALKEWMARHG